MSVKIARMIPPPDGALHPLSDHPSVDPPSRVDNRDSGTEIEVGNRVYVGNLSWDVSWQDLKDHMKTAGNVIRADVMTEGEGGRSKGCGIVEFETPQQAGNAIITLNNTMIKGRQIFVREDREQIKNIHQSS